SKYQSKISNDSVNNKLVLPDDSMLGSGMYSKANYNENDNENDNVISEENIEADNEDKKVKDEAINKEVDNGVIIEKDSEIIDQTHFSLIST
ncbi:1404_t:CDS:1, partial [Cetraspora pellucida]